MNDRIKYSWSGGIAERILIGAALGATFTLGTAPSLHAQLLDKQKQLDAQTFWDNRDFDWSKSNIPFFECPDAGLTTTYYYRWELITKHLTYGSPNSGYSFTEFIDRPPWSGTYGAISCPAGHQFYEVRWLRDATYARDYARYWFRTPGAQPRNYGTWIADGFWAAHQVHPDEALVKTLLPDLKKNYEGWEKRQFVPEVGLFWQNGHDDGIEFNINSRQTMDILRGAPGYRPGFNAYMWADALAIACLAHLVGDAETTRIYEGKAAGLKTNLQKLLWDPKREFFFPMSHREEKDKEGNVVKKGTLTYQTGKYAGSPHGRELHTYIPWQFNMPDPGYEVAWKFLMDPQYFYAPFGPTKVERNDPQFLLAKGCCWWSGQSWPFATSQTLKSLANLLQNYDQKVVSRADYVKLLRIFSQSHRKNGQPYLAEALHPDTGSFEFHDAYNHSEHYFHSSFNDLLITGLVGLKPRADNMLEIDPLAPTEWPWFALDDVPYRGQRLNIIWDKDGKRYGKGVGLTLLINGKRIASRKTLGKLTTKLPTAPRQAFKPVRLNYTVNNDGDYFPRLTASFTNSKTPHITKLRVLFTQATNGFTGLSEIEAWGDGALPYSAPAPPPGNVAYNATGNDFPKAAASFHDVYGVVPKSAIDGRINFLPNPVNRWTSYGSPTPTDWIEVDFGTLQEISRAELYIYDDRGGVQPPESYNVQVFVDSEWRDAANQIKTPAIPNGSAQNSVRFDKVVTSKLQVVFTHKDKARSGVTELEI